MLRIRSRSYNPSGRTGGRLLNPVILDLDGDGVDIAPLTGSNKFFDVAGDGYQHRTAWAAVGDAVLALDADGDGKITERNEIVFTDWDATAETDMEALAHVFDTNHNGKLDAGDAQFGSFRLMTHYSDGTGALRTLAQLGIKEINLTADKTQRVMEDGSSIDGQTTFTRSNGTRGTAATVSFAAEDDGGVLQSKTTYAASGAVTVKNTLLDSGGQLISETTLVTSADRRTRTLSFDDDGDGVIDRVRTTTVTDPSDGTHVETVSDRSSGILLDKVTTTTSADRATVTILRDSDGDGLTDQREVDVTNDDDSFSVTIQNLNEDGTVIDTVRRWVSTDGRTAITKRDDDDANGFDLVTNDTTTVATDGSRTRTVTDTNTDGSLRARSVTVTSANGTVRTETIDADGDGTSETTRVSDTTVRSGDGAIITVVTEKNGDGTTRASSRTATTRDGQSRSVASDLNGDGTFDATHKEATSIDADGNRTLVTTDLSTIGVVLSKTTTVKDADGITRTTLVDTDGNGTNDSVDQVSVASGIVTETLSNYRPDGTTLTRRTVTTTSADGLTQTVASDLDGDGTLDRQTEVQTINKSDGSATVTTKNSTGLRILTGQSAVTTSADGLTTISQIDLNGASGFDLTTTSVTALGGDGVRTTTETVTSADGTLQSKRVVTLSAGRNITTITSDINGDGATDSVETIWKHSDGTVTDVVTRYARNGAPLSITSTTTDDTGLVKTVETNVDALGGDDQHGSDTVTLLSDGRRLETVETTNDVGSFRTWTKSSSSADGLKTSVQTDVNGDGKVDGKTVSDTVLNANGSRTTTVTRSAGGPTATAKVVSRTATTVSDDGLSRSIVSDLDGNVLAASSTDLTTNAVMTLNADAMGGTSETIRHVSGNGRLIDWTTTEIRADHRATTITADLDASGNTDTRQTITVAGNGDVVDTTTAYDANDTLLQTTTVTRSADGLSTTRTLRVGNDATVDEIQTRTFRYEADGSTTEIVTDTNADANIQPGSRGSQSRIEITTSADGLSKNTKVTGSNEGFTIGRTAFESTSLRADGSRTMVRSMLVSQIDGSVALGSTQTITDYAHGLKRTVQLDAGPVGYFHITDETTVNADGSTTRIYTDIEDRALAEREVTWTSADGRRVTIDRDTNGDGQADAFKSTEVHVDGSRIDAVWQGTGSAGHKGSVTTTSADGRTQITTIDTDGDAVIDRKQTQTSWINDDGSTAQTRNDYNGKGRLRDRVSTTTSANGYKVTSTIDLDGDGVTDETFSKQTILNTDGSRTQTIQTKYADATVKNTTVILTSANGQDVVTQEDLDGDGRNELVRTDDTASSGVRTIDVRYYDASGTLVSRDTTTTSADGRLTTVSRDFDGNGSRDALEVESHVADGTGSYDIGAQDATSNGVLFQGNHTIDENGVDRIIIARGAQYRANGYDSAIMGGFQTVRQSDADRARVARIFDVLLDRDPTSLEREQYLFKKDLISIASGIIRSSEFRQRYGTLTEAQCIEQMYKNAYGRSARVSELAYWLNISIRAYIVRNYVAAALVDSAEHLTMGNVHAVTSSSRNVSGTFTLEHTNDKMAAANIVDRIYVTSLGRHGTDAGAAAAASGILTGTDTEAALADKAVNSSEFYMRYGTLNDSQFITQMFQNALGRVPTAAELSQWTTLLGERVVSRGDFVVGLAGDLDYMGGPARSFSSTDASTATGSSDDAGQAAGIDRMIQAMSTMSEQPHAAWASAMASNPMAQEHQIAAAHH